MTEYNSRNEKEDPELLIEVHMLACIKKAPCFECSWLESDAIWEGRKGTKTQYQGYAHTRTHTHTHSYTYVLTKGTLFQKAKLSGHDHYNYYGRMDPQSQYHCRTEWVREYWMYVTIQPPSLSTMTMCAPWLCPQGMLITPPPQKLAGILAAADKRVNTHVQVWVQ